LNRPASAYRQTQSLVVRLSAVLAARSGNPGDMIFKPREQWQTFWNASDTPARVLEIISPAGFENYFRELGAELINGPADPQRLAALCAR